MKKTRSRFLRVLLAMIPLAIAALPARATDSRIFAASAICNDGWEPVGPARLTMRPWGVWNGSGAYLGYAECGLERENLINLDGLRDVDVRLKNLSQSNTRTVQCFLSAIDPEYRATTEVNLTVTLAPGEAKSMDFNGALNQSYKWGHFGLECEMDPDTVILNILTREY
jgi:hypothetical protein